METHTPFDGRVPPPDFASVETTRFCNLQCRMCIQFNEGSTVAGPDMDAGTFERIARQVFPFARRWQPSVAGEPTMSKGFYRMLELAEELGVKAEMVTNGTLLSDAMVERLAPNACLVMFSFDGATKDTFETIRGGAGFEQVEQNVRKLVRYCRRHLPPDRQPQIGLNCTLMERNVRELPDLVHFAATELELDFVSCYHVYPATDEMKAQSLVHHVELAARCIERAIEVASEVGIALSIQALDQLTAAAASSDDDRACSEVDGVVAGLPYREVNQETRRALPLRDVPRVPEGAGFPPRREPDPRAPDRGTIWWCDFLWNKTYVSVDGDVRPCCVYGMPVLGNLVEEPFDRVWNNDAYRAMRQRLAARDPAPSCKGCMHVRETADPLLVDALLQGADVPRSQDLPPLPDALDPHRSRPRRAGPPPVLEWTAVPGARSYVVQFSLDRFGSILFSTDSARGGPPIRTSRYEVPGWAWRDAPADREIQYRVLADVPGGRVVAGGGAVAAQADRSTHPV